MNLFVLFASIVIGVAQATWTYKPTDSTCAATNASPCGPLYWGKVNAACDGQKQTPVDISNAVPNNGLGIPKFSSNGGCSSWIQYTDSYSVKVGFVDDGVNYCTNLSLDYDGKKWDLLQMHFHSPSEHTFSGGFYDAEAHMVHFNAESGTFLVLGVMLQEEGGNSFIPQTNNSFFQTIWNAAPISDMLNGVKTVVTNSAVSLNPYQGLLPPRPSHYRYSGSFTTPPCTEIVSWFVFDQAVVISTDDLNLLRARGLQSSSVATVGGNSNRPVQALNDRMVYYVPAVDEDDSDDNDAFSEAAIVLSVIAIVLAVVSMIIFVVYRRYVDDLLEGYARKGYQPVSNSKSMEMVGGDVPRSV